MPNPLIAANYNRGQQPPDRYQPVIEAHADMRTNRPYVGSIDHGVATGDVEYNPELDEDMNEDGDFEYEIEKEEKPIPVRIVSGKTSTEIKDFRVYRTYASVGFPSQVISRHDNRNTLQIRNLSADTVWIGDTNGNANSVSGFPLAANSTLNLVSTQEVYAMTENVSNPAALAVLAEFTVST